MKFHSMLGMAGAMIVAGSIGLAAVSLADEGDPIKNRREHMKGVGGAAKVIGAMLEGTEKFDAAKATEAANTIAKTGDEFAKEFDEYFPATSKEGDTTAAPAIWEKPDDFKKLAMSLNTDAAAAAAAAGQSEDAFKAAAGKMFGNCKSCHETFRVKK